MATDLDHIIDTALHPEVAITVFGRRITGKVDSLNRRPVGPVALGIAVDGAHLGGPGMAHDQEATFV